MRPKVLIPLLALLGLAGLGYYFLSGSTGQDEDVELLTKVRKGNFVIDVTATGELKAKRSEKIRGPSGMRASGIYQTTISDMVAEGTLVKAGAYVAALDKTELDTRLREAQTEIEKTETQLDAAKIDTAIELRALRDDLVNLNFMRKEKELQMAQSKYEAPMVIQQSQIELDRSERDYKQAQTKYVLSKEKAEATISEILATLRLNQQEMQNLMKLASDFTIKAPKDGMVIYARSWNGKVGPGSQISTWNPVVAELPDMSDMVSKTYVNEVDISRVRLGQMVNIKVDAFPDKSYEGQVIKVANIGEQLRNYDSKVFEVMVQLSKVDSILRPAMTTSNEIVTDIYEDVLSIPLEALHNDSLTYVFTQIDRKLSKQEVIAGLSNDDEIIIDFGLEEGAEIYLTIPPNADDLPIAHIDEQKRKEVQQLQLKMREDREKELREKAAKKELSSSAVPSGNNMVN
ncbi:MAG: efflux RND transporter periplasmic adaptor subunit [Bacteroidota bacterium]